MRQMSKNTVRHPIISNVFSAGYAGVHFSGDDLIIKSDNLGTGLNFGSLKATLFASSARYQAIVPRH